MGTWQELRSRRRRAGIRPGCLRLSGDIARPCINCGFREPQRWLPSEIVRGIIAHAVAFAHAGDLTIAYASSLELNKYGFYGTNNTPSAYLTGYLLGKRMSDKEAILDIGRRSQSHGSVIFACLKGVIDAGINVPHNKDALPKDDRINGKVLQEYAKKNPALFSKYEKNGVKVDGIVAAFDKAKKEISAVKPVAVKEGMGKNHGIKTEKTSREEKHTALSGMKNDKSEGKAKEHKENGAKSSVKKK